MQSLLRELFGDVIQPFDVAAGVYQDRRQLPGALDAVPLQAGGYAVFAIATFQGVQGRRSTLAQFLFEGGNGRTLGSGQFVRVQPRGSLAKGLERFPQGPHRALRSRGRVVELVRQPGRELPQGRQLLRLNLHLGNAAHPVGEHAHQTRLQHGEPLQHLRKSAGRKDSHPRADDGARGGRKSLHP